MITSRAALVVIALLLAGCASLSEDDCRYGDWGSIGYTDGTEGRRGDRLAEHAEACASYGIAPDESAYRAGRDVGLKEFCTPANGFRHGARGAGYEGVCPTLLEFGFVEGYQKGLELYRYEQAVAAVENEIGEIDRRVGDIDYALRRIDSRMHDDDVDDNERNRLHQEARYLVHERGRLLGARSQLVYTAHSAQADLLRFRSALQQQPGYADWTLAR